MKSVKTMQGRQKLFAVVMVFLAASWCMAEKADGYWLTIKNTRMAYFRGEEASLIFSIGNQSGKAAQLQLLTDIGDVLPISQEIGSVDANSFVERVVRFDTQRLRCGKYPVTCKVMDRSGAEAIVHFELVIAKKINPDRMPVWLWGGFGSDLSEESKKRMHWLAEHGFNSFQISGLTEKDYLASVDNKDVADRIGADVRGGYFKVLDYLLEQGLWATFVDVAGGFMEDVNGPDCRFKPLSPYGSVKDFSNPFAWAVADRQNAINAARIRAVSGWPNINMAWFNTEIEDFLLEDTPLARQRMEEAYPTTEPHRFIMPGVIADNDEGYVRMLYRFRWGDGLVVANKRAADMIHRIRPDVCVFSDPYRLAAVYDRCTGMDAISTWTYTNPDPKYMLFIETLLAAAKPSQQKVMHTITMLNYPGTIFPKDKGWTLMGPGRLTETSWINLSRRPDALAVYYSSACNPFSTAADQKEPYQKYQPSFDALKAFCDTLVTPYGPMVKKLEREKRKAAVLSSQSSRLYANSPTMPCYYDPYHVYDLYALLAMLQVPADVVFDETVREFGLDDYDVLFVAKCETLTKSVYDSIVQFQKRGGIVVVDQYFRAPLENVLRFDADMSFRNKVAADAIAGNMMYATWNDHLDVDKAATKDVNGVTAGDDQKFMEACALKLKSLLAGKVHKRVDCENTTVLTNVLEGGGVSYVFVINDKREYDTRTGPYKAILEALVPQTVRLVFGQAQDRDAIFYDVLAKKKLTANKQDTGIAVDINTGAAGGTILAMMKQEPNSITIKIEQDSNGSKLRIDAALRDVHGVLLQGIVPIRITLTDAEGKATDVSDYYAMRNGILTMDVPIAINDKTGNWKCTAEELIAGSKALCSISIRH